MLRNRRAGTIAGAAVLAVFAGQLLTAADDVVVIKGGTFSFEAGNGQLDISGTQGFTFASEVDLSGGTFGAYDLCQVPECPPGTTLDLDAGWSGNDLLGRARLRGITYDDVGRLDGDSGAVIRFSGTVTMPPMSDEPVSIAVPFRFSGRFSYGLTGPEEFESVSLTGGGDATLLLRPDFEGTSWIIDRVVFDFDPAAGS
jgi:hypothetical protein